MTSVWPEFEQLLHSDPANPALDRQAVELGEQAIGQLQAARDFERQLAVALAVPAPDALLAQLQALPDAHDADFEQSLRAALAVPVPSDLHASLAQLPQRSDPRTAHWFSRRSVLALAASLLLTAGLVGGWLLRGPVGTELPTTTDPLLVATVEHLSHEPFALTRTETVPPAMLDSLLQQVGLQLAQEVEVNYAYPCPIGGQRTVHMVMQQPSGPVTVIYFRQAEPGLQAGAEFSYAGLQGRVMPLGQGMLVLIGQDRSAFASIEQIWRGAASA